MINKWIVVSIGILTTHAWAKTRGQLQNYLQDFLRNQRAVSNFNSLEMLAEKVYSHLYQNAPPRRAPWSSRSISQECKLSAPFRPPRYLPRYAVLVAPSHHVCSAVRRGRPKQLLRRHQANRLALPFKKL